MTDTTLQIPDRRIAARSDRRKHSRSGRRATDPRTNWRRIAWLVTAYAMYLSIRSLSATMKNSLSAPVKRAVPDSVKDGVRKLFRREPIQPA